MNNNESKIWEKFYGKKVCSENLNIEGFKKAIPFDIYDGHAICEDYKGHRFDMVYPQLVPEKEDILRAHYLGDTPKHILIEDSGIKVTESFGRRSKKR